MMSKKKKIILAITVVVTCVALILAIIYIFISKPNTNIDNTQTKVETNQNLSADDMTELGTKALKENDTSKARDMFERALEIYRAVGDNDAAIEVESLMYLIDNPVETPTAEVPTNPITAGSGEAED